MSVRDADRLALTLGDRASAFTALFLEHSRSLLGYALRRVERPEDAADVVAETMLVAWRRLDDVPGGDETRPWLFGVARNVLGNQHRTNVRGDRLGAKLREQLGSVVHDHAGDVETAVVVREALAALDDDDRELLRLTSWEGLSPSEVAVVMSMPAATMRTRLHRARARLRAELARRGVAGERDGGAGHVISDERTLVRDVKGES